MKYPITPEFLEAAPEYVVQLYRDLETFVLDDICRRFRESGEATATALEQIRLLQRRGLDLGAIEAYIRKTLSLSDQAFDEIFDRAVQRNRRYFDETLRRADIEEDTVQRIALTNELDAIRRQTKERFYNITQSMGFALRAPDGRVRAHSIASAYQKILDDAELEVWSGGTSYREAVRGAVRRLSGSGLQWIDYESGHHNRVDVAARRAVMTGITQLSAQYSERTAEILQTPLREVTAHIGARDCGEGWQNHKRWQGRVYAVGQHERYPDIYAVCGLGYVDGLEGANCRHMHYAFVEGVSERAWTDEQLANIDPPPFTYQGKTYTAYDATQKQRQIETAMRAGKRDMVGYRAAGLEQEYQDSSIRLRRLNEEYKAFSKAANLPTQPERAHVEGFDKQDMARAFNHPAARGIAENTSGKGAPVQKIGRIDIEKYQVVSDKIRTDEVIITDERIAHIKERHPNDFERYAQFMNRVVEAPDYILEANKPNTAFVLKEFVEENERFQLILRLSVEGDAPGYKNSIITFLKVEEKRYQRYLRTKKILYKSE